MLPFSVISLCLIGTSLTSSPFATTPGKEPYYMKDDATGPTLPCSIDAKANDLSQFELHWSRIKDGHIRYISRDDKLYEKTYFDLQNDANGKYDLLIKKAVRSHVEGEYSCSAIGSSGVQYSTDPVQIIWLVPPGDPMFVESPSVRVTEGENVRYKCESKGGSPAPEFTWILPNGTEADKRFVNSITKGDVTESTLDLRVFAEQNGLYVSCGVKNKATDGKIQSVNSERLNVFFKPRVHVFPVQDLAVEEGQVIELICESESNPSPPSYEWTHMSSGERYMGAKWPVIANRTMTGAFECAARNDVGRGNNTLNLNVQYAPILMAEEKVSADEGQKIQVECMIDANPKPKFVSWTGPGGFIMEGPILVLDSVTRDQAGNYTCSATNYLEVYGLTGSQERTGAAVTYIDVKRPPGKAVIRATQSSVLVGETIELSCNSPDPGSPTAQYKWASPASGGQLGSKDMDKLYVRNAQLSDNGQYSCVPFNYLGEGERAVMDIKVVEPARISRPLAIERVYNAGETPTTGLVCESQGYPAPHIRWMKDGALIDGNRYHTETTIVNSCSKYPFCSQTVIGTLNFSLPIQWADKGNYSCVATNIDRSADVESWSFVLVLHGPVILNQRFPSEGLSAADVGSTAEIKCVVSARPKPTISWMFDSQPISEGGRYSFRMQPVANRADEYEHVLTISNVDESDYGDYLCQATNGKGDKADIIINLGKTEIPRSPTSLQRISTTPVSILLGWRPGFDGGFDQTFTLEYKSINPFTGKVDDGDVSTIEIRNATRIEEYKTGGFPSFLFAFNVTGLRSVSTYYFRIRAANKKGASAFSENIVASTADVSSDLDLTPPQDLQFDLAKRAIQIEPSVPIDSCTMLYVSADGENFRSGGCYPSEKPIPVTPGVIAYKARFCQRTNTLRCSNISPVFSSGPMKGEWRSYIVIPAAILASLLVAIVVTICCCRRMRTPDKMKRRPTISSMPQVEAKNTIVHGSNADSGIFTLDSGRPKDGQQAYSSSSEDGQPKAWSPDNFDHNQDSFLSDRKMHNYAEHAEEDIEENSISETDESDGRRVMREIIV